MSSEKVSLLSGALQGSILGHLLFILFFNDFPESLTNSKVNMYTDDTVMDVSHKDQETVKDLLDKDLESIAVCFESNVHIVWDRKMILEVQTNN